jgi:hypothetical protein
MTDLANLDRRRHSDHAAAAKIFGKVRPWRERKMANESTQRGRSGARTRHEASCPTRPRTKQKPTETDSHDPTPIKQTKDQNLSQEKRPGLRSSATQRIKTNGTSHMRCKTRIFPLNSKRDSITITKFIVLAHYFDYWN